MSEGGLRDAGLVRAVGKWSLAACILSTVIGAGIFTVPGALAACVGPYAPLVFQVCGLTTGAVALCFAEGGSRIPTSGGCYDYIQSVFGPLAGFVAGTMLWVGEALACGGIAAALADAIVTLVPPALRGLAHPAVIVIVIGGIAWINIYGVEHGALLINLVTILKLAPLYSAAIGSLQL